LAGKSLIGKVTVGGTQMETPLNNTIMKAKALNLYYIYKLSDSFDSTQVTKVYHNIWVLNTDPDATLYLENNGATDPDNLQPALGDISRNFNSFTGFVRVMTYATESDPYAPNPPPPELRLMYEGQV
jgi:hypothetical protein